MTTAQLQAQPRPALRARLLTGAAAVVVAVAAVISGMATTGTDKRLVVIPLALVLAALMAVVACTRFSAFVMLILGVRASLDLFKLSGSSAGNTATNTVSARGLDPASIVGILFLLAATLWLCAQHAQHGRLRGSRLRLAIVAFSVTGILSIPGASQRSASALEALRILAVVMMFVVLEQLIVDRKSLNRILVAAYVSLVFPLLYAAYGLARGGATAMELKGGFSRLSGPFAQSTTFARYLGFMVIFGVAILPYVSRRLKLLLGGLLAASSVFLLMTLTRGEIIGAVLGVVVVAVVQRRKTILTGIAIVAIAGAFAVPGLGSRFAQISAQQNIGGAPTGNTLQWRINYWTEVLPLANVNPVTGIGLGMTQYQTDAAKQPHNDFIRAYVETGIVGLGAYLAMLAAMVGTARRGLRAARPRTFEHAVAAGALGCSWSFIITSLAANVMSNVVSLVYLFTFVAAASYVARSDPHNPASALLATARAGSSTR